MSSPLVTVINEELKENLPITDRGLAYGDGIFETMLLENGSIALWGYHYQRLTKGLLALKVPCEEKVLFANLNKAIETYKASNTSEANSTAVVKLIVTRGSGGRAYCPPEEPQIVIAVVVTPLSGDVLEAQEAYQKNGIEVHYCQQAIPIMPSTAGCKTLNQLAYVLAADERQSAVNRGCQEGLMLTEQGHVVEATARNIFIVKKGELYTPELDQCGVAGVLREYIIRELAPKVGVAVNKLPLLKKNIQQAEEIFLCNSVAGIWPVVSCEGQQWEIGPITKKLQLLINNSPSMATAFPES